MRQSGRVQRQLNDGLIGRVHLLDRRRGGHVGRQFARDGGNGVLHVLRGRVNVAVERKLDGDASDCPRVLCDVMLVDAGDGGELPLQGSCATDDAMVSGLAPGKLACTCMVGKSMFGRSLTGSERYPATPKIRIAIMSSAVITGGG